MRASGCKWSARGFVPGIASRTGIFRAFFCCRQPTGRGGFRALEQPRSIAQLRSAVGGSARAEH